MLNDLPLLLMHFNGLPHTRFSKVSHLEWMSMISFYCLRAVLIVHTFIDADNDCKNFSMCSDLSKINCYKCFSKYK